MNGQHLHYPSNGQFPRPGSASNPLMTNILMNSPLQGGFNGVNSNFSSPQAHPSFNQGGLGVHYGPRHPGQPTQPHLQAQARPPYNKFGPGNGYQMPGNLNVPPQLKQNGIGQHNMLTPPANLRQLQQDKRNPLHVTMDEVPKSPGIQAGNHGQSYHIGASNSGRGQPSPAHHGYLNLSGAQGGAPGPRSMDDFNAGLNRSGRQGGINPNNVEFKHANLQSPIPYGHHHEPVHAIGDMNDPLSKYRAHPNKVDLEGGSRGKLGYSPKPKRGELEKAHHRPDVAQSENLVSSHHMFGNNPRLKKAPPKSILKKKDKTSMKNRPKSTTFNQDVMVHEVESWKIYNVDMGKEAKRNFRRETQQECVLI